MTYSSRLISIFSIFSGIFFLSAVEASTVWTFAPLTNTQITVDSGSTATIQYTVTNQSKRSHTLLMMGIPGISQTTTVGNCDNPLTLGYLESCTLTLVITGSELTGNVVGGPVLCQQGGGTLQCNEPIPSDSLNITLSSMTSLIIGDSYGGGTVACLTSGGGEANLIAARTDNSTNIIWGGAGTMTGAQSDTDGATNTAIIVTKLGSATAYAAGICADYTGGGFTDWFLPAEVQLNCLYQNSLAVEGFANKYYWSSTEDSLQPTFFAAVQSFENGFQDVDVKNLGNHVRCVRAFTPP